jgi:pre-mRNA-splicing helicase BRR2
MDELVRKRQFEYESISNRVLAPEIDSRRPNDPTGEAESLRGKELGQMGDRAARQKPPQELKKAFAARAEKPVRREFEVPKGQAGLIYYPKTRETRQIYESFLSMMQGFLGDQPDQVIREAVDEVLAVLKTDNMLDTDKKIEIESIIGPLSDEQFNKWMIMSKQLTDYDPELKERADMDEEAGMAVLFDTEKDENQPQEDIDQEMSEEEYLPQFQNMQTDEQTSELNPSEIDAFWVWRLIKEITGDIETANSVEKTVIDALGESDIRVCENKLVMSLGFDHFDLVKLLLENKYKILMCTMLGKAQTDEQKQSIKNEMASNETGREILQALDPNYRHKTKERQKIEMTMGERMKEIEAMPKNIIDLKHLEFESSGHTMTNQKVILPLGSSRESKPGYEEVFVPSVTREKQSIPKIPVSSMPPLYQPAFSRIKELNEVQSKVYDSAANSDENLLICAPTGSGKTNIALICILNTISNYLTPNGSIDTRAFKIIYVAPMKALVSEVCGNLRGRLNQYGINVQELTGDMQLNKQQIASTQVIITTPEKWDIITRKSGERTFTESVRLVIIDEIHLLHDMRGPVLEALVARLIRTSETTGESIRLVGLSATLPNYADVARFLRVNPQSGLFHFDRSFRPVPLEMRFIGITEKKAIKRLMLLNEVCYDKIMAQMGKNQVLVFVHSRKETAKTAKALRDLAVSRKELNKIIREDSNSKELLKQMTENVSNADLKTLLPDGIAIHHAGLSREDRTLVEDLFADKHIQILVSTATLAWGVNLPAHTVIIKGTQVYSPEKGSWIELSPQDMLQMIGRAGRIDYDKSGEGIIITTHNQLQYYLSLLNQQLPIESQMISQLADHLNAEIVLGTISNFADAQDWLEYTYLSTRIERDRSLYTKSENTTDIKQFKSDLIHSAAVLLDKYGLIRYDRKSAVFTPTSLGQVASHYYLKPQSIAIYNENLKPHLSAIDLLRIFSLSHEFKYIPVREEEKQEVAKLMEKVPIPVKGAMDEPASKMNVLLQAYISKLRLEGFTLMSDMVYVSQSAGRIMRALFEICLRRNWAQITYLTLNFCKMISYRIWNVMSPLRQFGVLSEDILLKIEKKEGLFWEHFYDMSAQQIGDLIKLPKMGGVIHRLIHVFPRLQINAYVQPITRLCLRIELSITKDFEWDSTYHGNAELFWIFIEDVDSEIILYYEQFMMKKKYSDQEHVLVFTVPLFEPLPPHYFIRVVSDRWIKAESLVTVSFRHLILPDKFPAPTELLDLHPVPIKAIRWPEAEKLFDFEYLNKIQSQTFGSVYNTSESCLVAAPTGSGKSVLAELVTLRHLAKTSDRILYITASSSIAELRNSLWQNRFSDLGESVYFLKGDINTDLKGISNSRIIISSADCMDSLSRRWKSRKVLHTISLLIIDEIHLLSEPGGVLEVVVSRLRYMATQLDKPMRILALGTSIANSKDLAEWLGIPSSHTYNFAPPSRPNKLELIIHSFDQNHRPSRILAMSKPVFQNIKAHASFAPVLIFVPDRKVAKTCALDLLMLAAGEKEPKRFLIKEFESAINDRVIQHCLYHGVGILHEGLTAESLTKISKLYQEGYIQVLVSTVNLCYSLDLRSSLVIIYDTMRYDGKEHRYVDYSLPEVIHMMGRASLTENNCMPKCVLLCHTPRKEFYKKFLTEPIPVESHLDHYLTDHFNGEIASNTITNKQDAVDWITWTYLYRRLVKNPNYYNLQGVSGVHINDHLSELVENTIEELTKANCITVENEMDLKPLNLGIIAAHYYIKTSTVETFASALTQNTKIRGLIEVLASATEFESIPIRQGDNRILQEISNHLPEPLVRDYYNETQTKTLILLQAHFSRLPITSDLAYDQAKILEKSARLIQAMVDVISSNSWLRPALYTMTLSQMITQAMWDKDSPLLQLPYFNSELIEKCSQHDIEDIVDLMNMENELRNSVLNMTPEQLNEVARVCNAYPSIDMSYSIPSDIIPGEDIEISVSLSRDDEYSSVHAPYFPHEKDENWWVLIGDMKNNLLLGVKKVKILNSLALKLTIEAPDSGVHHLNLMLLCDSYMGADQSQPLQLTVK